MVPHTKIKALRAVPNHGSHLHLHLHGALHWPRKAPAFRSRRYHPSNHLHNVEHSSISMTFFAYAAFAILLDKISPTAAYSLTQFIAAIAFAQQLLLFHFHSAYHMGIEGQYHLLMQSVVVVSLTTTLMGIGFPNSFMVSFIRSISILYQDGHQVVNCSSHEALHRAKSLENILFSWTLIAVTIFSVAFYLVLAKLYGEKVEYSKLEKEEEVELKVKEESDDLEYQKGQNVLQLRTLEDRVDYIDPS
ncbi:hypothetical protein F3Y22_tig00112402pilonHSYRG00293 [Hibiscus syriacus]|uniref:Uncharacterized protein n=1 Tax=Hibiscus syriacus TaxID=106335 RepID=A0A6A2XD89_HIBSY|nr:hypothetical protein F3Y22_tig00112402pilonHSYRG00293 [Hibiscus syriacus]